VTAALVTLMTFLVIAALSGLVAKWSLKGWPTEAPAEVDELDPEGNQAAVTRAMSVAARKVAP